MQDISKLDRRRACARCSGCFAIGDVQAVCTPKIRRRTAASDKPGQQVVVRRSGQKRLRLPRREAQPGIAPVRIVQHLHRARQVQHQAQRIAVRQVDLAAFERAGQLVVARGDERRCLVVRGHRRKRAGSTPKGPPAPMYRIDQRAMPVQHPDHGMHVRHRRQDRRAGIIADIAVRSVQILREIIMPAGTVDHPRQHDRAPARGIFGQAPRALHPPRGHRKQYRFAPAGGRRGTSAIVEIGLHDLRHRQPDTGRHEPFGAGLFKHQEPGRCAHIGILVKPPPVDVRIIEKPRFPRQQPQRQVIARQIAENRLGRPGLAQVIDLAVEHAARQVRIKRAAITRLSGVAKHIGLIDQVPRDHTRVGSLGKGLCAGIGALPARRAPAARAVHEIKPACAPGTVPRPGVARVGEIIFQPDRGVDPARCPGGQFLRAGIPNPDHIALWPRNPRHRCRHCPQRHARCAQTVIRRGGRRAGHGTRCPAARQRKIVRGRCRKSTQNQRRGRLRLVTDGAARRHGQRDGQRVESGMQRHRDRVATAKPRPLRGPRHQMPPARLRHLQINPVIGHCHRTARQAPAVRGATVDRRPGERHGDADQTAATRNRRCRHGADAIKPAHAVEFL